MSFKFDPFLIAEAAVSPPVSPKKVQVTPNLDVGMHIQYSGPGLLEDVHQLVEEVVGEAEGFTEARPETPTKLQLNFQMFQGLIDIKEALVRVSGLAAPRW